MKLGFDVGIVIRLGHIDMPAGEIGAIEERNGFRLVFFFIGEKGTGEGAEEGAEEDWVSHIVCSIFRLFLSHVGIGFSDVNSVGIDKEIFRVGAFRDFSHYGESGQFLHPSQAF